MTEHNNAKKLGVRINNARKDKHMAQAELAYRAYIDRSYMGRIERGETNVTVKVLYQIAHVLDVPPSHLLP